MSSIHSHKSLALKYPVPRICCQVCHVPVSASALAMLILSIPLAYSIRPLCDALQSNLKFAGINDGQQEFDEELEDDAESQTAHSDDHLVQEAPVLELFKDIASVRKSRTKVFAVGMDLATIARTSVAVSSSSPKATAVVVSDASVHVLLRLPYPT
ncbi:hypothetical protein B0H14DRAFT_3500097 [Mycena olivaceomarginata]|nr:hypothetical protein B0H14DRAFT_3500097 [Mycena olivaceomarginata]